MRKYISLQHTSSSNFLLGRQVLTHISVQVGVMTCEMYQEYLTPYCFPFYGHTFHLYQNLLQSRRRRICECSHSPERRFVRGGRGQNERRNGGGGGGDWSRGFPTFGPDYHITHSTGNSRIAAMSGDRDARYFWIWSTIARTP